MPTYTNDSTYVRKTGTSGSSASGSASCGTFISSTMMVMMTAMTPSLNASSLALPIGLSRPHALVRDVVADHGLDVRVGPEPQRERARGGDARGPGAHDRLDARVGLPRD